MTASRSIRRLFIGLATATATLCSGIFAAEAQTSGGNKLYVGALSCNVSGSTGFVFGSTKELNCVLIRSGGASEGYTGTIRRFGIDIGFTRAMHVVWHVYSLSENAPIGALQGNYGGTQTSITAGGTAGDNALYGGANNSIVLTSVVVQQGKSGLNLADGIAEMSLQQSW